MKNIHILPTDKPSRLALQLDCKPNYNLQLSKISDDWTKNWQKQNIYITNSEEIKEGDWHLVWLRDKWEVINYMPSIGYRKECLGKEVCKIILTTDQDLIGVQAIDDEFLKWFVKNSSCEDVKVVLIQDSEDHSEIVGGYKETWEYYKIIIPKQEPKQPFYCSDRLELDDNEKCTTQCDVCSSKLKQDALNHFLSTSSVIVKDPQISNFNKQETLEEAKDLNYWKNNAEEDYLKVPISVLRYISELEKQQEKMYSEEEVIQLLLDCRSENPINVIKWFKAI